jgi:hypothetical protein
MRSVPTQTCPALRKELRAAKLARLEVGVGQDDERVLAAELEDHALEVAPGVPEDVPPRVPAAREDDEIDIGRDRRLALRLVAEEDLKDIRRQPLRDAPHPRERRERRLLARLEDHGVARHERGQDGILRHHDREVPRRDRGADAVGVVEERRPTMLVLERARRQSLDAFVEGLRETLGRVGRLPLRVGEWLAHLAGREEPDLFDRRDQRVGRGTEEIAPRLEGERSPRALGMPRPMHERPTSSGGVVRTEPTRSPVAGS